MTLTETAQATKRGLRLFLIFGFLAIVIWIVYLFVYNNIWKPYTQSQIKPEQRFGSLQKPIFPNTKVTSSTLEYTLDTTSGALPTRIPRLMNVYFIPAPKTTLLAPERARKLADTLEFSSDPTIISPSEYRYLDKWGGTLTVELSSGNFSYKRLIPATLNNSPLQFDPSLPPEAKIIDDFTSFLTGHNLNQPQFNKPRGAVAYDNPNHQLAENASVSLWPGNIGDYPIVSSNPDAGPITAQVNKNRTQQFKYSEVHYSVWSYDPLTYSSYETTPIQKAYDSLKNGKAVVVKYSGKDNKASITQVYLAYYLPNDYQPYLEPIYVFEGDNFTAYVPALTDTSYAK